MPRGGFTTRMDEIKGVGVEWFTPTKAVPQKLIIYIHGGGFIFNGKLHRGSIARIARTTGITTIAVDYALAPEHPFPAALNEIVKLYKTLINDFESNNIVFIGDSAGGTLVLAALVKIRDSKIPIPAGGVAISPVTDGNYTNPSITERQYKDPVLTNESIRFFLDMYNKSNYDLHEPLLSPQFADPKGLPPLLLQVGEDEILFDDSAKFVEKARKQGVDATLSVGKGMWHAWYMFAPYISEGKEALNEIAAFVKHRLK